ncbi:MAG: hypothetical protein DI551_04640 [Micavibrio aeruginosavorus]|uniref:Uncharacterized protein n=1 Tax=Micavibrio aeruginosavorus TaxID=349221 RepID=A0A2W5PWB1_9BACT|nr:MAG: hypothetical protein DI551_04640 [Micavibrio aeruginosavorus]
MLIYIIGAIFLMGLLIVLLKGSFQEGTGIDGDKLVIAATQVQQYAGELSRGVNYVMHEGYSETDLRFGTNIDSTYGDSNDELGRQIFSVKGGGVEYKLPQEGINDGTPWQFYGTTHLTDVGLNTSGEEKAELIAVLPNVTEAFCSQINRSAKQAIDLRDVTDPAADGCINAVGSEFNGAFIADGSANKLDDAKLTSTPALEACVKCADGTFNYYKVLMSR